MQPMQMILDIPEINHDFNDEPDWVFVWNNQASENKRAQDLLKQCPFMDAAMLKSVGP